MPKTTIFEDTKTAPFHVFFGDSFYYVALQALSVWHCIKKATSKSNDVSRLGAGIGTAVNPGGRVRKLEQKLRFADTFENRVALADGYLAATQTDMEAA